ncbi:hypothetical protein DASC09_026300 [Saccharomycopsis crataegensis]|uniref:TauD/TfdA-like domain-containing protein n=1 Tax=Saccharomycopsis crataegensis TaxID=43959 RepID=A0AAV5QK20_9ASCO|nr:hypothetical protein DASC09_026300 [Saccharomycopsis crataegensis]
MIEITRAPLPDAHIVNGKEFPALYNFKESGKDLDIFLRFLADKAKTGFFAKALADHGAIVLRDSGFIDPESLSKIVETISVNSNNKFFFQAGSTAQRSDIAKYITSANEGDPSINIHQHNEFSRFDTFPRNLFFICQDIDDSTIGGETPLVHGYEFFETLNKIYPQYVKDLAEKKLYFKQVWKYRSDNNTSWENKYCFGQDINPEDDIATKKEKAEKQASERITKDWEWDDDNNLVVHQHTVPIRYFSSKYREDNAKYPVFFNSLATYYYTQKHGKFSSTIQYDNKEDIPTEFLEAILENSIKLEYNHKWKKGDIAIVDNYQVSHGRLGWSNGSRKVVVSMWDDVEKLDYPAWVPGEHSK